MNDLLKVGDLIYIVYRSGYQKSETGVRKVTKVAKNGVFWIEPYRKGDKDIKCFLNENKLRLGSEDSKVGEKASIYKNKESYETEKKWESFCSNIIYQKFDEESMNKILSIYDDVKERMK